MLERVKSAKSRNCAGRGGRVKFSGDATKTGQKGDTRENTPGEATRTGQKEIDSLKPPLVR